MDNTIKTTVLLGSLTGLFLMIGELIGGQTGMIYALFFAVAMNMGAWWFSDKLALSGSGAREVSPQQAPELHRIVEELAGNAQMPKPRVYVIDTEMPNAFATGRGPENGAVAVTTGIMKTLARDELAGVVAHELAHIRNRDTLIASIAATLGGAIASLANMAMWGSLYGSGYRSRDERGSNAALLIGIVAAVLAPLAATIIRMAISRSREFEADAEGARILGDPVPLARALEKIEAWAVRGQQMGYQSRVNPATSHMYIINPLFGGGMNALFRTHPPTSDRIARLMQMRKA